MYPRLCQVVGLGVPIATKLDARATSPKTLRSASCHVRGSYRFPLGFAVFVAMDLYYLRVTLMSIP